MTKSVILIAAGTALIILSTYLRIPLDFMGSDIPATGQSLAILLVGMLIGSELGSMAAAIYLALGLLGLPVFSGGASGFGTFLGPSGGYLYSFVPAAYLVGTLAESGWGGRVDKSVLAMLLGTMLILLFGSLHMGWQFGWDNILQRSVIPFLPGAALKVIIGGAAVYLLIKYIPGIRNLTAK